MPIAPQLLRPPTRTGLIACALSLLVLAAGGSWYLQERQTRVLRVGFTSFDPYLIVTSAPEPEGMAAQIIARAARDAHLQIEWVQVKNVEKALTDKKIDLFPLLALTPERKSQFYASQPWWENEMVLISLKDHAIGSAAAMAGKRLLTRDQRTARKLADKLFPGAQLIKGPVDDVSRRLCQGEADAIFIDLRILESEILRGKANCTGRAFQITAVPDSRITLGTVANREMRGAVSPLYDALKELSMDGTLMEIASHWGLYNPYQSRFAKESLEAKHRMTMMRFGLGAMILVVILISLQSYRIRVAHHLQEEACLLAEEHRQRFDAFMRYMPAIAFIKDADGRYCYANQTYCDMFQISLDMIAGKLDHEVHPAKLADEYRHNDFLALSSNQVVETLETGVLESGEARSLLTYKFPFENSAGDRFLGAVALDITERQRSERALKLSQFSIDCVQDTMLWVDSQSLIFNANLAACRNLGYERTELIGRHISEIDVQIDQTDEVDSHQQLKEAGAVIRESLHRRKDGAIFPVEIQHNYLEFEGRKYRCCMCRDITERKLAEVELSRQARHDALTGLPNRRFLENQLAETVNTARRLGSTVAVVFLDLDGFKLVNDTLGHAIGDQLLKQVAGRLKESLRSCDMLFRMGGDEFTLLLTGLADQSSVTLVAHKLLANLHESFNVEGHDLSITASIGVSLFPQDGNDESQLLRNADAAMYESKRLGKNRVQFFTPEMGESAREQLELENQLRRALSKNELSLHYQPEFNLDSGAIVRHEALLRWNHPTLGSISPAKFIPIAEETTLIVPIGTWVLEEACRKAQEWQSLDGGKGVGIAVNVSLLQFGRPDFVDTVTSVLRKTGLAPYLLELELTESVVMHCVDDTAEKVKRLRRLGISVAIDDFGTGYSSLSYLQQLPMNVLKIDRSFIRDIASDPNAVSLTGALISMAHSLGMQVVVEGIENSGQLAAIQQLGCDIAQGFFLSRPVPVPLLLAHAVAA